MKLRVKEICASKGITLQQLAERLNMKRESLSRSINGNPTLETLARIAESLEVPLSDLIDDEKRSVGITCPHCGKRINIKVE